MPRDDPSWNNDGYNKENTPDDNICNGGTENVSDGSGLLSQLGCHLSLYLKPQHREVQIGNITQQPEGLESNNIYGTCEY